MAVSTATQDIDYGITATGSTDEVFQPVGFRVVANGFYVDAMASGDRHSGDISTPMRGVDMARARQRLEWIGGGRVSVDLDSGGSWAFNRMLAVHGEGD